MSRVAAEDDLVLLRRELHRAPELSGEERATARAMATRLDGLEPDELLVGLGGHGVAAVFEGGAPGPTVLLRAELDALPIQDAGAHDHRSVREGVAHSCGHDGHMAMAYGVARRIALHRPDRGRFVVLFQPAEETGAGGPAVAADPRFRALRVDRAFAVHNLPGSSLGKVVVREGTFCCASRGLEVRLTGRTSHAAHPEEGLSPAAAMCALVAELGEPGLVETAGGDGLRLVTVVHARVGEATFGTAPGAATVLATLRAEEDAVLDALASAAEALARGIAARHGLGLELAWHDAFAATRCDGASVEAVRRAARELGHPVEEAAAPIRWSEDFGAIIAAAGAGALFGLGAGEAQPPLHASDYDFPDGLLGPGVALLERTVRLALDD